MKIAIPLFYNRVSPRFDFAPTLLVATVEKNQIVEQKRNQPQKLYLSPSGVPCFKIWVLLL